MPNYGVAGIIRVNLVASLGGTNVVHVFHIKDQNGVGFTSAVTAAAGPFETFLATLSAFQNTGLVWERMEAEEQDSDAPEQAVRPLTEAGVLATTLLPRQTALAVTWNTGVGGRRRRGRTYLCGFTEGDNDTSGVPTAALVAAIEAAGADLIDDLDTAGTPMHILSRGGAWLSGAPVSEVPPRSWVPFSTEVRSATCDARWDTQRRRRLD